MASFSSGTDMSENEGSEIAARQPCNTLLTCIDFGPDKEL